MKDNLLFVAAFVAALSVSAAQAQDEMKSQTSSTPQADAGLAPASPDTSGYGGTRSQSAAGSMTKATGTQQPGCVGPMSYCDIYKGGN